MTPAELKGKAGRRVLVEGVIRRERMDGDFNIHFDTNAAETWSRVPASAIREILPEPIKAGDRVKWHDGFEYTVNAIVGGRAWVTTVNNGLGTIDDVANLSDLTLIEPAPAADPDGWIEWNGGENPVPGKMVDVRWRTGVARYAGLSDAWRWKHIAAPGDIIAYRVVGDAK